MFTTSNIGRRYTSDAQQQQKQHPAGTRAPQASSSSQPRPQQQRPSSAVSRPDVAVTLPAGHSGGSSVVASRPSLQSMLAAGGATTAAGGATTAAGPGGRVRPASATVSRRTAPSGASTSIAETRVQHDGVARPSPKELHPSLAAQSGDDASPAVPLQRTGSLSARSAGPRNGGVGGSGAGAAAGNMSAAMRRFRGLLDAAAAPGQPPMAAGSTVVRPPSTASAAAALVTSAAGSPIKYDDDDDATVQEEATSSSAGNSARPARVATSAAEPVLRQSARAPRVTSAAAASAPTRTQSPLVKPKPSPETAKTISGAGALSAGSNRAALPLTSHGKPAAPSRSHLANAALADAPSLGRFVATSPAECRLAPGCPPTHVTAAGDLTTLADHFPSTWQQERQRCSAGSTSASHTVNFVRQGFYACAHCQLPLLSLAAKLSAASLPATLRRRAAAFGAGVLDRVFSSSVDSLVVAPAGRTAIGMLSNEDTARVVLRCSQCGHFVAEVETIDAPPRRIASSPQKPQPPQQQQQQSVLVVQSDRVTFVESAAPVAFVASEQAFLLDGDDGSDACDSDGDDSLDLFSSPSLKRRDSASAKLKTRSSAAPFRSAHHAAAPASADVTDDDDGTDSDIGDGDDYETASDATSVAG
jgi:hypothetical protein